MIIYLAYRLFRKLEISELQSLFFTYVYSMLSPLLAQAGRGHGGTADIVITLLYWTSLHLIYSIFKNAKSSDLIKLVIIIMIASQIKQEGLFLAWSIILLPISKKRKALMILFSVIPSAFWYYFRFINNIPADYGLIIHPTKTLAVRFYAILKFTILEMSNLRNWYVFWPLFWLAVYIQKSKNKFIRISVQPILVLMFLSFFPIYLFSNINAAKFVGSSIDRVFLQLSPFIFIVFVDRTHALINYE